MKNILGLDLGTNSIGWAVVKTDDENHYLSSIMLGSRIIPMTQDVLSSFEGGVPIQTSTAQRTQYRGVRRLYERRALRRERLLRVLHLLGFLPAHYDSAFGWNRRHVKTFGKRIDHTKEPKIAWSQDAQGKPCFLFMDSYQEMLADFAKHQPELVEEGKRVPYDWTLYYLRQKALCAPITKEELAWILLNFNQKRGYYQLRGKDDTPEQEDKSKRVEYVESVVSYIDYDENEKVTDKGRWYNVHLDNGMIYHRQSKNALDEWVGKKREFIVTTQLNPDGSEKRNKEGGVVRSFRSPDANDWTLRKVRSEHSLEESGLTVGAYIYQHLLSDPSGKIIGKFVQTIDRHYYKDELLAILRHQMQYHPALRDAHLLEAASLELYAQNESRRISLQSRDMPYLLIEDILFYQRPLKSKKSLISNCPYESHKYVDTETGELKVVPLKCIAKSNPYFQEFRLRQFIQNLRIYDTTGARDEDVTAHYLPDAEANECLYRWMASRAEVTQESFLKEFLGLKKPRGKEATYPLRWNYVEDKKYPAGETRALILKGFEKAGLDASLLDDFDVEYRLWHVLYSIDDVEELRGALCKFAQHYGIVESEAFADNFAKLKPFEKEYGSYSEKAIKRLLSQLREGKSLHEACYETYSRYSEGLDVKRWQTPDELRAYLVDFQQHSLRNPIVEQCVLETLRTVADIWQQVGHIDEIHLELGREMKNPADKRKRISDQNRLNEATNMRIKLLLQELLNDPSVSNVRPNSPMQQDILRIYEEGALLELQNNDPEYKEILAISKLAQPSQSQLTRYRLWLEQRYRSPYTGKVIPLSKLFTAAYQIEHVIPRARYYDDSLNNKVICEAEVNAAKSNLLAHEFIAQNQHRLIQTVSGPVAVFNLSEYECFIKEHYARQKAKLSRLMMDDIPEEFIQRQLNDSRYISKLVKSLLSNIVREEGEDQDMSKNVIVCTGSVTDRLKKDWGLNDVWNQLVYPRYERLNQLTGTELFGHWEQKDGHDVFQTSMPLHLQGGYSKKRIDHRHHAMDALVIACASRNIVNLLSNLNAHDGVLREDLRAQLSGKRGIIFKPWPTFTLDALRALQQVVVSFKHKERVLTRATNRYEHYDAEGRKHLVKQEGEHQVAVRKALHKESVYGHVNLRRTTEFSLDKALADPRNIVNARLRQRVTDLFAQGLDKKKVKKVLIDEGVPKKVELYYMTDTDAALCAIRKPLDESFDQKKILSITDTGIQKILLCYLASRGNNPKEAFSPDGIAELNAHISDFNRGKMHQPILRVRTTEPMGVKFPIGTLGNKSKKYVEAQKGTNLFYAVYEGAEGERNGFTIPLNTAVECLKCNNPIASERDKQGNRLLFVLSPSDLVYVPNEDELNSPNLNVDDLDKDRIYTFVSCSGVDAFFIPHRLAKSLLNIKKEQNFAKGRVVVHEISIGNGLGKISNLPDGASIKRICWKLEVNRLGQITRIIR